MNPKDVKWCPQHGYPLPCAKCGMPLTQLQQKEIYEVGMRKVIDWIEENALRQKALLGIIEYCWQQTGRRYSMSGGWT